ncbi:MAG TPA: superoxide dismutase family protein [Gemmatimonadota bacterium]|nr:superoxide dismutase family protein [Gemmatimonadota bacterium]
MKPAMLLLGCSLVLAACGQQGEPDEPLTEMTADTEAMEPGTSMPGGEDARAEIRDAEGNSHGVVLLRDADFGVLLSGTLTGFSPGEHGFHIHETGSCEPPTFESAGRHFAPEGRQHGFHNPEGPHAGDLRNLVVLQDGSAIVDGADSLVTLREGPNALLDADGAALVVHPNPDDYRTQPSGGSGDPIACGVIEG